MKGELWQTRRYPKYRMIDADTNELMMEGLESEVADARIGDVVEVIRGPGVRTGNYKVINLNQRSEDGPLTLYVRRMGVDRE